MMPTFAVTTSCKILDLKVVKDTHFMGLFLFLMYQDPILDAWNIY